MEFGLNFLFRVKVVKFREVILISLGIEGGEFLREFNKNLNYG